MNDIQHDDASYSGDVSTSPVSMDYWRSRALEFQSTMNAIDTAYWAAIRALDAGADPNNETGLAELIREYESRRTMFKVTTEAINAGAAVVNAAGGRFPRLSLPAGLAAFPAIPVAAVAALAGAAALISWGQTWLSGVNQRLLSAQMLDAQHTPEARAELAASIIRTQNAVQESESGGIGSLVTIAKWGGIALAVFLAYRAFAASRGGD